MIPGDGEQHGLRTEIRQSAPELFQQLVKLFELRDRSLLDEVSGEEHHVPGTAVPMVLGEVMEESVADVRPEVALALHPEVQVRQVQPTELSHVDLSHP